jgi:hypothetical protein
MIRNVVIHMLSEQPLVADIYSLPSASDAGLVCTNMRTLDGKRPVFIDRVDSVFFFPYRAIRFLEIPPEEMARHVSAGGAIPGASNGGGHAAGQDDGPDAPGRAGRLPVPIPQDEPELAPEEHVADLEIDEDFLRRIRDI